MATMQRPGNTNAAKSVEQTFSPDKWPWSLGAKKDCRATSEADRTAIRKELESIKNLIKYWKRLNKPQADIDRAEAIRNSLVDVQLVAARESLGRFTARGLQVSNAAVSIATASDDQAVAQAKHASAIARARRALDDAERATAASSHAFQRAATAGSSATLKHVLQEYVPELKIV